MNVTTILTNNVYGSSTAGKTWWVINMAFVIARGLSYWRGFNVTPGDVVYVAAEAANGVRKRLRAYAKHHDISLEGLPFRVISDTPNLMKGDHEALAKAIGKADFVVIDTFAAVTPGAEENSSKDVGTVVGYCKHIQEATGALVILVHHSGKNEAAGARGSSALRAAVDVEICIRRNNDDRVAEITKLKDGDGEGRKFPFRLQVVDLGLDQYGEPDTSCVIEQVDDMPAGGVKVPAGRNQRIVFDVVRTLGVSSVDEILRLSAERIVHDPEKRDRRRDQARDAMNALIDAKSLWYVDGKIAPYGQSIPFDDISGGDSDDGMS